MALREEAASAPLLEKTQPAAIGFELEPTANVSETTSRAQRKARRNRITSVLLLAGFALGLALIAVVRHHAACRARMQVAELAVAPITKRAEANADAGTDTDADDAQPKPKVLECFQVAQPVLTPQGPATNRSPGGSGGCTVTLMDHVFGNSYGAPYVGDYAPPAGCPFNRVVMNFTVVSQGRQFDRLALMYLNDTEVWRTSTAEPVNPPGIRWVYLKDMTHYLALWKTPQRVIFDLGNLQNDKYTASFNATLTATFFQSDGGAAAAPETNSGSPLGPSDVVIPISARKSATGGVSQFTLPKDNATNTVSNFPRNARRAVFSVSANGQADEEFWWSNVLQSDVLAFNATAGQLTGFSPFREVQVLIDGQLAGVQWPFPVVFTGGVVPSLHRPIVGADVFDLREHEIDITAWLPLLCDGQPHTFSIRVAGLDDSSGSAAPAGSAALTATVADSWYVTGKIFVWVDSAAGAGAATTGSTPVVSSTGPTISVGHSVQTNATGANMTLQYTVAVSRSFSVQGMVAAGGGGSRPRPVSWSQSLEYANQGVVSNFGFFQVNNFSIRGSDKAVSGAGSGGDAYTYGADYAFPLFCNTTADITPQGNMSLWAYMDQGLELQVSGASVFPTGLEAFDAGRFAGGSVLRTRSRGTAAFSQSGDGRNSSGFGSTNQEFHFGGLSAAGMLGATPDVPLYTRNVTAANQTIVLDRETIAGGSDTTVAAAAVAAEGGDGGDVPYRSLFAQAPLNGGRGSHVFTGRGGANPEVAVGGYEAGAAGAQPAPLVNQMPMRRVR